METRAVFDAVAQVRAAGQHGALATVIRVNGSAYRHEGAKLLVTHDGTVVGNVSGGCLEQDVIEVARLEILRLVHDTATDECFDAAVDSPASEGSAALSAVRNLYAAPIRTSRGKTVGVVQLHNKATHPKHS